MLVISRSRLYPKAKRETIKAGDTRILTRILNTAERIKEEGMHYCPLLFLKPCKDTTQDWGVNMSVYCSEPSIPRECKLGTNNFGKI